LTPWPVAGRRGHPDGAVGTPFRLTSGRQTANGSDAGVILANGHTVEEIQ
jgi:hypothetical protein